MINKTLTFITDNKKDLKYILLLTIFLLIISIPKLLAQYSIGIGNWDTYLYLENGRNFAKMGWGDVPSISPVLPMIISKMFLLAGHPYHEAIFNIDVFFYIIGSIVFYLLLRLRYGRKVSLIGSVIYSTFTLLYSWVAIGGNDIIGITGTILTIYLILIAHKYNNKIYYVALPIAAYAFLSRYTAGVMIFSIVFYWIVKKIEYNEIKHIFIGAILGIISVSWFLYQFYIHLGTPFPFLGQFSGTVSNTVVMDSGFLPDSWYYVKHIPNYLNSRVPDVTTFNAIVNPMGNIPSVISFIYIALIVMTCIIILYKIINAMKHSDIKFNNRYKCISVASVILFVVFMLTLGNVSYIISTLLFLFILWMIRYVLKSYELKNLDMDLFMCSLMVIYLVFQSILFTKNDRYFITVLPFIAYFITYSINEIYNVIDQRINTRISVTKVITSVIVIILLFNTMIFVSQLPTDNDYHDIEEACTWLMSTENINNSTVVYSDNWPAVSWYMNIYCQRGVPNVTDIYYQAFFSKEILTRNNTHRAAAYYIDATNENKTDYPGMKKLDGFDTVQTYKNKYLAEYGYNYTYTQDYADSLSREINEFNRTISG